MEESAGLVGLTLPQQPGGKGWEPWEWRDSLEAAFIQEFNHFCVFIIKFFCKFRVLLCNFVNCFLGFILSEFTELILGWLILFIYCLNFIIFILKVYKPIVLSNSNGIEYKIKAFFSFPLLLPCYQVRTVANSLVCIFPGISYPYTSICILSLSLSLTYIHSLQNTQIWCLEVPDRKQMVYSIGLLRRVTEELYKDVMLLEASKLGAITSIGWVDP